jgi:hypothetical protein
VSICSLLGAGEGTLRRTGGPELHLCDSVVLISMLEWLKAASPQESSVSITRGRPSRTPEAQLTGF